LKEAAGAAAGYGIVVARDLSVTRALSSIGTIGFELATLDGNLDGVSHSLRGQSDVDTPL
jgi:hypothetical protein